MSITPCADPNCPCSSEPLYPTFLSSGPVSHYGPEPLITCGFPDCCPPECQICRYTLCPNDVAPLKDRQHSIRTPAVGAPTDFSRPYPQVVGPVSFMHQVKTPSFDSPLGMNPRGEATSYRRGSRQCRRSRCCPRPSSSIPQDVRPPAFSPGSPDLTNKPTIHQGRSPSPLMPVFGLMIGDIQGLGTCAINPISNLIPTSRRASGRRRRRRRCHEYHERQNDLRTSINACSECSPPISPRRGLQTKGFRKATSEDLREPVSEVCREPKSTPEDKASVNHAQDASKVPPEV